MNDSIGIPCLLFVYLPHPIVRFPEYGISFHFGHLILHSIAIAMRSALRYILLAFAMIALLSGPS